MNEVEYYQHIRQWAKDRNLIEGSTPTAQFVKLVEEFREIRHDAKDGIGDCLVVMTIICAQRGIEIEYLMGTPIDGEDYSLGALGLLAADIARGRCIINSMQNLIAVINDNCRVYHQKKIDCLAQAWGEIKDRKGRMINNVFVKEEDLCNTQAQSPL
mgnify:CR=1 FL=1